MPSLKFTNNGVSLLAGAVLSGATSFSVLSGEGVLFPVISTGEYFYVRLGSDTSNEIKKITNRVGDNFTCEALNSGWPNGTNIVLTMCSEVLGEMAQLKGGGSVLTDHELKDYSETKTVPGSSSGTLVLDLENGNVFEVILTENISTLTLANPPASGKGGSITLIITQDATGLRTITWPAAVKWPDGEAPELSTDASTVDIIVLITVDGGTTWFGALGGSNYS